MKEKNLNTVRKLHECIRELEEANRQLAEQADDIVLLSMISERLMEMTDHTSIIQFVLEKISVLKDISFIAFGLLPVGEQIILKSQYASFSDRDDVLKKIQLKKSSRNKLSGNGSVVKINLLGDTTNNEVLLDFDGFEFKPSFVLLVGTQLLSTSGFFLFVDDKENAEEKLDDFLSVLIQINNLVSSRFENLRLAENLKRQNQWLVEEVNRKTADLREKLNYQLHINETSLDGVLIHNKGTIEYVNPAALKILEAKQTEDVLGRSIFDFLPENVAERKNIQRRIQNVLQNNRVMPFRETKVVTAKGHLRILEVGGIPFIDGKNTLVHLTLHDVTDKKEMERELAEERNLFMGGPTVVFKWIDGAEWPVYYVSSNVFEQFGYRPEELLHGKVNYDSMIHPDDRLRIEEEIKQFKAKGIYQYEQQYRLCHADGSYRQVMDFTIFHPAKDGKAYYHGYVIDITKQVEAEKALTMSQSRYQAIVEYSFEGIGLINDQYTFTYVNPNLCKIVGYPCNEIVGTDFRVFLSPDSLKLVTQRYKMRQEGKDIPPRYELSIIRKDGSMRYVEISSSVIKDEEDHSVTLIQLIDITERKLAEEEIKKTNELLKQNYQSLQAVQNIMEAVQLPFDLASLAKRTLEALSHFSGTPSVGFFVLSKADNLLELVDAVEFPEDILIHTQTIPLNNSLSGLAVKQKKVIVSANLLQEKKIRPHAVESFSKHGYKATMSVPLLYQDEVLGVINLLFNNRLEFIQNEIETFQTIGKTLGLALANVNHMEALEKEIVQRITTEDSLRESEEKFRVAFHNSLDAISLTTPEGKYIDVNRGFLKITGYVRHEVIGKTAGEINIWKDNKQRQQVVDDLLKQKVINNLPVSFIMKNGRIVDALLSVQYLRLQGNPYLLMTARDITDIVRMQQSLRENEEKFRLTFNHASDAMFLLEVDEAGPPVIHDLNETACKLHQYTRSELIDRPMSLLMAESILFDVKERVQRIMKGESLLFESQHRKKDGSIFPIEISAQKVTIGDKVYILSIDRDISERKKTEHELRLYREELEKLVKERTVELEQVNQSLYLKNKELTRYNDLFINREFRIKELREEVRMLKKKIENGNW